MGHIERVVDRLVQLDVVEGDQGRGRRVGRGGERQILGEREEDAEKDMTSRAMGTPQ